jgi:hypothetical protein
VKPSESITKTDEIAYPVQCKALTEVFEFKIGFSVGNPYDLPLNSTPQDEPFFGCNNLPINKL